MCQHRIRNIGSILFHSTTKQKNFPKHKHDLNGNTKKGGGRGEETENRHKQKRKSGKNTFTYCFLCHTIFYLMSRLKANIYARLLYVRIRYTSTHIRIYSDILLLLLAFFFFCITRISAASPALLLNLFVVLQFALRNIHVCILVTIL